MKDSELKRIMAKIKKLLAMADEEGNASDNEREMALRQATSLMDKYALSMVDIDSDVSDPRGQSALDTDRFLWKPMVFSEIARLFGCTSYRMRRGRKSQIIIVGRESARITVMTLGAWAIASIDREAKRVRANQMYGGLDSFRKGASMGIRNNVDSLLAARRAGETTDSTAGTGLMVVEQYAAEDAANKGYLKEQGVRIKSTSTTISNRAAAASGAAYGNSLNLSPQVRGNGQGRLS